MSGVLTTDTLFVKILIVTAVTAGTALLMWIGESITEKGIGNGVSLIIFISIISKIPSSIVSIADGIAAGNFQGYMAIAIVAFVLLAILGVIAVQEGTRKIPVQYAKRVVGRKVYGGKNTHLPLKVNQSGVIPIIFASVLTMFPSTIASFFPNSKFLSAIAEGMKWGNTAPTIIYLLLIIAFSFFYTLVTFNPVDVADNLQQYGGFIPGIRPGKPTVTYLKKILNRLTLSGGLFLALIAILPIIAGNLLNINLQFGGTSLLIVVGVALETVKQLEQQMIMRNYKGFLK
jgi:preprotein translocase subunit SecY